MHYYHVVVDTGTTHILAVASWHTQAWRPYYE